MALIIRRPGELHHLLDPLGALFVRTVALALWMPDGRSDALQS